MPKDSETGESYDSPEDALASAMKDGASASEVLKKLEADGYSLESSGSTVGIAIGMEKSAEEKPEGEEEYSEESATDGKDKKLAPGMAEDETMSISMGMEEEEEPMSKKRDKVAQGLMDKFQKNMV